jgi:hypothetical protein
MLSAFIYFPLLPSILATVYSLPGHFGSLTGSLSRQRSLSIAVADALASAGGSLVGSVHAGTGMIGSYRGEGSVGGQRQQGARTSLDSTPMTSNAGSLVGGAGMLSASLGQK